jgi:hypothetical protein
LVPGTFGSAQVITPGATTNATTACQPRTPWIGVDSYYKIKGSHTGPPLPPLPPPPPPPPPPTVGPFGQGHACGTAGSGCAGSFKKDLDFERLFPAALTLDAVLAAAANVTVFRGNTTRKNESGLTDTAVIVSRAVPASLTLRAGTVERFMATVTTTVAMPAGYDPAGAALREYSSATAAAATLLATHSAAWGALWVAGSIEVEPADPPDRSGRALDIQSHLYSSFYYLLSSIREDWPHGALNPGGLASDNYDTVFFDMEFYMEPALLWFWPPLARAMTEFRFEGLGAAEKQADVFGKRADGDCYGRLRLNPTVWCLQYTY